MKEFNDGGHAFPGMVPNGTVFFDMQTGSNKYDAEPTAGMKLRDYFAAKALVGLLAEPIGEVQSTASYMAAPREDDQPGDLMARAAYRLADAMLRAREGS